MSPADFRLGDFVVRPSTDRLSRGELRIDLEPKTMAVLLALAARPGDVVSYDELIHEIWHDRPMGENPVYKAVAKLRRVLEDETGEPRYIETIPRKGYRLLVEPLPLAEERAPPSLPATRWRLPVGARRAAVVASIGISLLAIGGGYATFNARTKPEPAVAARAAAVQLYFPGLDSNSVDIAAINTMIGERLALIPGLAVSDRGSEAALASLRLSGSVQPDGENWRVRMRLDGERGDGLWASELVLPPAESYRIADQLVAAVQEAASMGRRKDRLASLPLSSLQLYLQARTELRERRPGFQGRMRDVSDELVRAAPGFAPGYASLAVACIFSANRSTGEKISSNLQCARAAVARALELDPELAEAHAAAGLLAMAEDLHCRENCSAGGSLDASQRSLERAVRLDPELPEAHNWLGIVYFARGELSRSSEQNAAALALDPLSPIANQHVASDLLARGESDLAREQLLRISRMPGMPWYIDASLGEIAIARGRFDEARSWAVRAAAAADSRLFTTIAAALLARSGATDEARGLLAKVLADPAPLDAESLFYATCAKQRLGGPAAVRELIEAQLALPKSSRTADQEPDIALRLAIGHALTLANLPGKARSWLETVYDGTGVARSSVGSLGDEVKGLESLAWVLASDGNSQGANAMARRALELLATESAAGFDRNSKHALASALALQLAGRREQAIAEVERAVAMGWAETAFVRNDPRWGSMQTDPALHALLARADERAARMYVATAVTN